MDSYAKSLYKAISWRIVGTIDTFLLSWFVTGSPHFAFSIASFEVLSKICLYWIHERAWLKILNKRE